MMKNLNFVAMNNTNWLWGTLFFSSLLLLQIACTDPTPPQTEELNTVSNYPEIEKINQKIKDDPQNAELLYTRALAYQKLEGYDEAISDLTTAIKMDSSKIDYHHLLADVYLDYSKSYQALNTMKNIATIYPNRIPTLLKLSQFQLILKKHDESMATIGKILELDPQNAEAFFLRGLNFKEKNITKSTINSLQKAVELDPDITDAWIMLGELFAAEKNPAAIQYFDNAVRVDPNNIAALHTKANYLQQTGSLLEAIEVYRNIIQLDPSYSDAYYNTGLAYLEMDSVDLAYRNFDIVVKTDPTNVSGYYFRGVSSQMKGAFAKAKNDYQQAINLAPEFEQAKKALNDLPK